MKNPSRRHPFRKNERLSGRKYIQELFNNGSSFFFYPFKVVYLIHTYEDIMNHQVLFSVSRKSFKKAVDRNKIKRRIREAYRLNKQYLAEFGALKLFIAYIYVGKEIHEYDFMEGKLKESLIRLKGMILAMD